MQNITAMDYNVMSAVVRGSCVLFSVTLMDDFKTSSDMR